jgi:signal transduction histidine kinase
VSLLSVRHVAESGVDRLFGAVLAWSRRLSDRTVDGAIAVVVACVAVTAATIGRQPPGRAADALAYAVIVVASLVLVWRRQAPTVVFVIGLAAGLVYFGFDYPRAPALWPFVIALYTIADTQSRRRSLLLALGAVVALAVDAAASDRLEAVGPTTLLWIAAWLLAGWLVSSGRARRAQSRDEHSRRMVDAERLRIARELHDVVAHSIATINVQAGVATHVIERRPEQAAVALVAIKESSKEALRELRGILAVLRSVDDHAPRFPEPGLDRLQALAATTAEAGLPVNVELKGRPRPLPRTLDATAYRIIQESLTNALRYAGPARAAVTLTYGEQQLLLEITDDGVGTNNDSDSAGLGIVGMRERAAAFGGELEAGPRPDGGFRVKAVLPLAAR